jgi:hypothetical protein
VPRTTQPITDEVETTLATLQKGTQDQEERVG